MSVVFVISVLTSSGSLVFIMWLTVVFCNLSIYVPYGLTDFVVALWLVLF